MYEGQEVPLPLGQDGLFGAMGIIPPGGLRMARGLTFHNHRLEKEPGATTLTLAAPIVGGAVKALLDYHPVPGIQRTYVIMQNGAVLRDEGGFDFGRTLLPSGTLQFSPLMPPAFIECGHEATALPRKLVVVSGINPVYLGTGDATTLTELESAKIPVDWRGAAHPSCGVMHGGRLWLFQEHTGYYSTLTDHGDFQSSGAGQLTIASGDGERITAAASFRKMLVVFKYPRGIFLVDTSNLTPSNWYYVTHSRAVGCPGPHALAHVPNDLLFLDASGNLNLFSATALDLDAEMSDISTVKLGDWIQRHADLERIYHAAVVWYGHRRQAHIYLPAFGAQERMVTAFEPSAFDAGGFQIGEAGETPVRIGSYRLVADFNRPRAGAIYSYSTREAMTTLATRMDTGEFRPIVGTETGHLIALDQPSLTFDGQGYDGEFETDDLEIGQMVSGWQGRETMFDFLELWAESQQASTLTVSCRIDGVTTGWSPITFQLPAAGTGLGSGGFQIGVSAIAGHPRIVRVRRRLFGRGQRFGFKGTNSTRGEGFKLVRAYIGVRRAA